ncbi:YbaK/EbsC family protein [Vibrio profundum]|uniref:aminoacyl-tRNA deacylase n=1 Tax=Vibrio profundum TaxID=2910247 RepID=UPI003D142C39
MTNNFSTKVTQYLVSLGIEFTILPQDKPTTSIRETAAQRGICTSQMVKSILLKDMAKNYILACIPGDQSVDPKKVRAALGCRRVTCASEAEIQSVTGYGLGTVNPLLLAQKDITILFDPKLQQHPHVSISSGNKHFGLALSRLELERLCTLSWADICRD